MMGMQRKNYPNVPGHLFPRMGFPVAFTVEQHKCYSCGILVYASTDGSCLHFAKHRPIETWTSSNSAKLAVPFSCQQFLLVLEILLRVTKVMKNLWRVSHCARLSCQISHAIPVISEILLPKIDAVLLIVVDARKRWDETFRLLDQMVQGKHPVCRIPKQL